MNNKIYGTITMNDKGQVVIPVEARNELNLIPGSRLTVMRAAFGDVIIIIKTEMLEAKIQELSTSFSLPQEENK